MTGKLSIGLKTSNTSRLRKEKPIHPLTMIFPSLGASIDRQPVAVTTSKNYHIFLQGLHSYRGN